MGEAVTSAIGDAGSAVAGAVGAAGIKSFMTREKLVDMFKSQLFNYAKRDFDLCAQGSSPTDFNTPANGVIEDYTLVNGRKMNEE